MRKRAGITKKLSKVPYIYTKKFAKLGKDATNITLVVRKLMKEQHLTQRKLGKMLGWRHTTINAMLKRPTWNIAELLMVGKALNHDLLKYFYLVPPEAQVGVSQLQTAQTEIERLNAELKTAGEELLKLRTENKVLREVFSNNANR
ncbi:MAG: hypothetical protein V4615_02245 [Bacteroidota bacterium]